MQNLLFIFTFIFNPFHLQPQALKTGGKKPGKTKKTSGKLTKKEKKNVYGGTHWRIQTPSKGPIHVWVPKNYNRKRAGTVFYIHGYHTTADKTWDNDKLGLQFRKSRQNAIFIVPEAPGSRNEAVVWESLRALKRTILKSNIRLPNGPTIVIGHSGAFRTISRWSANKLLAQIILLDAMYGAHKVWDDFIGTGKKARHHKLVILGKDTADKGRAFAKKFPFAVIRKNMPARYEKFTKRQKRAKLLLIRSQYSHMSIVTSQSVIPVLLRLTPLKLL
ncbi:MAG: hypothetical protein JXR95_09825 [Deltaproteobacteria bacterium]|nr:hypothetical protein [Deltaproteobacteria bacterium]